MSYISQIGSLFAAFEFEKANQDLAAWVTLALGLFWTVAGVIWAARGITLFLRRSR